MLQIKSDDKDRFHWKKRYANAPRTCVLHPTRELYICYFKGWNEKEVFLCQNNDVAILF